MNNCLSDTLTVGGAVLVKSFGRQSFAQERFNASSEKVTKLGIRRSLIQSSFNQVSP